MSTKPSAPARRAKRARDDDDDDDTPLAKRARDDAPADTRSRAWCPAGAGPKTDSALPPAAKPAATEALVVLATAAVGEAAEPAACLRSDDSSDDSSDNGAPLAKRLRSDDSSDGAVLLVKRTREDNRNDGASSAKPDMSILRHIAHRMLTACLDSRLGGADLAMCITLVYSTVKNMSDAALENLQLVDDKLAQKIYPYAAFSAQLTAEARTNLRNICMHMIWRWIGDVFKITRIAPFIARMCANNGWLNHDQTGVYMAQKMYGRAIDPALGLTNLRMVGQNVKLVARADGTLNDLTGGRFVGCTLKLAGAINLTDVVLVDCHIATTADVDLSVAKMLNCRVVRA